MKLITSGYPLMMMKIGFRMTIMTMWRDITMMDLTIENGCEVEYPRDPKGRKWKPIED